MAVVDAVVFGALVVAIFSARVHTARILFIIPPEGSHLMNGMQIAQALLDRGHDVHAVMNGQCSAIDKLTAIGITVHKTTTRQGCSSDNEQILQERIDIVLKPFSLVNMISMLQAIGDFTRDEADGLFDTDLVQELKDLRFDLSIVDGIHFIRFVYLLPYKLGVPVVSLLALFNPLHGGIPALPSFSPVITEGVYSDKMSLPERIQNTLKMLAEDLLVPYVNPGSDDNMVSKYAPEKHYKSLRQLASETKLWLVMTDVSIDYPRVSMPHVVNIGGINTRPPKPLPADIQKIADKAGLDGLVVVSFGAMVSKFPVELRDRIYADLKQLKQTVLWRYTGDPFPDLPDNIKLVKWLPQIDLLAHPNTKVFVTHCGCNGQFEALYHGVPMVGVPLFGDQVYNAIRMAKKGMGIRVDTFNFPPGTLAKSIEEVLSNESYSRAAKRLSSLFRDRPMTPIETATYWIEHVLTHGSDHLVPASLDLSWYQFWCLDVITVFVTVITIVVFILMKCIRLTSRSCYYCLSRVGRKQKAQ